VELDLGRFTVLIGEQASGKSVLAKLIAIAKDNMLLAECLLEKFTPHFSPSTSVILFGNHQIYNFFSDETYIEYQFDTFKIVWSGKGGVKQFIPNETIKERLDLLGKMLGRENSGLSKFEILQNPYFINNAEGSSTTDHEPSEATHERSE